MFAGNASIFMQMGKAVLCNQKQERSTKIQKKIQHIKSPTKILKAYMPWNTNRTAADMGKYITLTEATQKLISAKRTRCLKFLTANQNAEFKCSKEMTNRISEFWAV